jgi:hypothetical protein
VVLFDEELAEAEEKTGGEKDEKDILHEKASLQGDRPWHFNKIPGVGGLFEP